MYKFLQCVPQFYTNILHTLYDLLEYVGSSHPFYQKHLVIKHNSQEWNNPVV